jgi:hypothetical protein
MNSEEIKQLLEKYYEGATTSGEELILKKFFNMDNVPPELRSDQEIFRYYMHVSEIPEPSADFEKKIISAIDGRTKGFGGFRIRRQPGVFSVMAAAILILAGLYFFFTNRSEPRDTYTDPEVAYAETMKILFQVSARFNQGTKALGHLSALQDETDKTMATVSRSTAIIEDKMKPLDTVFEAIGKAGNN